MSQSVKHCGLHGLADLLTGYNGETSVNCRILFKRSKQKSPASRGLAGL